MNWYTKQLPIGKLDAFVRSLLSGIIVAILQYYKETPNPVAKNDARLTGSTLIVLGYSIGCLLHAFSTPVFRLLDRFLISRGLLRNGLTFTCVQRFLVLFVLWGSVVLMWQWRTGVHSLSFGHVFLQVFHHILYCATGIGANLFKSSPNKNAAPGGAVERPKAEAFSFF